MMTMARQSYKSTRKTAFIVRLVTLKTTSKILIGYHLKVAADLSIRECNIFTNLFTIKSVYYINNTNTIYNASVK